jgi:prepilin-type N-terminal cleavage/methylation domain-containing protein
MTKVCRLPIAECGESLGAVCRSLNPKSTIRNQKSKGFTLIEILVFIVIAGILLPAIIVPFATAVKGSGKPEKVATAIYLAHQKMEEFMKFDYSNATLAPTALTAYANTGFSTYQWQWEILYLDSNFNISVTDQGYKRILVRVKDPENDTYEIYSGVTNFP